jgi:hypothetical protein
MTKSRSGVMLLLALTVFVSLSVVAARAEAASTEGVIPNHPALNDRFAFELGAFYFQTTTQASLTGPNGGGGVVINFEDALGLQDRSWGGIGGFLWRMTERWRLEVEYFSLDRSASRTLATEVRWGDRVYPVGATVNSSYDFSDTRVSVGYSFFKRRDKELGVGVGLHMASIKASIESTGTSAEAADVLAPLPVLSIYGAFALTDQWAVRMRADWLSLTYDIYSGDVRNIAMDVLYQPFRHVGFGLGMRSLALDVSIDDPKWRGQARTAFSGPTMYMTVSF